MSGERLRAFVESVRDDPRVLGVARLAERLRGITQILVVTTWDGAETLPLEIGRLAAPLVGGGAPIQALRREDPAMPRNHAVWRGLGEDGTRVTVALRRAGDLVPAGDGLGAESLHDPRGVVESWLRACRTVTDADAEPIAGRHAEEFLWADFVLRAGARPLDARESDRLRSARMRLSAEHPAERALAARIDAELAATPLPGEGLRVLGGAGDGAAFERFLTAADAEGFKGDRVLFSGAVARIRDLAGHEPVFEKGFVVPTFDAVEAAFATDGAGMLRTGIYVGVGVTPADALEFWAAPYAREGDCAVPCVDDDARRDVVQREAGRAPMVAALAAAVDAAWARLPAFVERCEAARDEQEAPDAILPRLHLPRSFVERARRALPGDRAPTRFDAAMALARAGDECAPLAARKFGLAAGRVLARR